MRYIGTKIRTAEAMTRADYNAFRGWTMPADLNGADEGYLVEDIYGGAPNVEGRLGYVSWMPKAQFDNAYRPCDAMTIGLAIEAIKRGQRVQRASQAGNGKVVLLVPTDNGPTFAQRATDETTTTGWRPTLDDMLAEDWQIVE